MPDTALLELTRLAATALLINKKAVRNSRRQATARRHLAERAATEKAVKTALRPLFRAQVKSAAAGLRKQTLHESHPATVLAKNAFDPRQWDDRLTDAVLPPLAAGMARAGVNELLAVGVNLPQPGPRRGHKATTATAWLAEHGISAPPGVTTELPPWMEKTIADQLHDSFAQPWWDGINDTTADDVETVIRDGVQGGLSIDEMADQIETTLGDEYYEGRSQNIAITESANALNGSRKASMDALADEIGDKVPMRATWLSILSDTTREAHAELDGVPADGDGMWDMDGYVIPWPAHWSLPPELRCNCRCSLSEEIGLGDDEAQQLIDDYNDRVGGGDDEDEEEDAEPADGKSYKGGEGSGNFGHEGRPGEVGGSGEGGVASLSFDEKNAVELWTRCAWPKINRSELTDEKTSLANDFHAALDKLPIAHGSIYRGLTLEPWQLEAIQPGSFYIFRMSQSFTTSKDFAEGWAEEHPSVANGRIPVVLEMAENRQAKDLGELNTQQKECVMPYTSNTKVLSVDKSGGLVRVKLKYAPPFNTDVQL